MALKPITAGAFSGAASFVRLPSVCLLAPDGEEETADAQKYSLHTPMQREVGAWVSVRSRPPSLLRRLTDAGAESQRDSAEPRVGTGRALAASISPATPCRRRARPCLQSAPHSPPRPLLSLFQNLKTPKKRKVWPFPP